MQVCAAREYLHSQAAGKKAEIQIVMIFCCFRKCIKSVSTCIDIQGLHVMYKQYFRFFQLLYCHFSQSWKRSASPGMVVLEGL